MSFFPIGFTAPFVLSALLLLPVIWWLLRLTPPRPRQVAFPPTRLLFDIEKREETPEKSPWWLTLLRLLLAAALIVALAGPIWRPAADTMPGKGPLWLFVDNGWSSAKGWQNMQALAEELLDTAGQRGATVLFAATADGASQPLIPQSAAEARDRLRALEPRAWPTHRATLTTALRKAATEEQPGAVVWLTDNLSDAGSDAFLRDLDAMSGDAGVSVYEGLDIPLALAGARNNADALTVAVLRRDGGAERSATIRALDLKGRVLAETEARLEAAATNAEARFDLPVELRNDVAKLEVAGEESAGSVQLLDDRWQRRSIGLVSGASVDQAQPLLSPLYYLQRALSPFAELRVPRDADLARAVPDLIEQGVSVLILADVGRLPDNVADRLARWVDDGGMLVRFAGPRMAGGADDLTPTRLRAGDRSLGGSLSWEEPQPLAAFSENSPFAGLEIPGDVTVTRQVLAEPSADLPDRSWALLSDGTPLVTASLRGRGRLVLFHVTADTSWSNLPLSGSFVEMLRRIIAIADASRQTGEGQGTSNSSVEQERTMLPPLRTMDGYGHFSTPGADALPIAADAFDEVEASRTHPAGIYGSEDAFRALNVFRDGDALRPLDLGPLAAKAQRLAYPTAGPTELAPVLLMMALALLLADAIAMIMLRGDLERIRHGIPLRSGIVILMAAPLILALSGEGRAQDTSSDLFALNATLDTRLAYVVTGDPEVDGTSQAGLLGLSRYLMQRTALEPEAPVGVDITQDELSFFPLLYWPITTTMPVPSDDTMARIDAYMRNGGTILFDTRDQLSAGLQPFGTTENGARLRAILEDLDIPPLEPVPIDHVLTKAFYLLDQFPGRYSGSPLWVEAIEPQANEGSRPVVAGDGVSTIMITGNDFAGAWATTETGTFLFATVPSDPAQREYAYRSGVNIVMYALTGNYKADQVHIPALLERLGQ
ncbi:DUF4159 domain-containing protein [Stappia sp. F7233]|uniref:DUF4159 domain-containing protein n=1 Tax=Stappia albiluteola TaxID=2758565 RepID=A0A839A872_9HYPH|nr:DUF4159 domain-containing protein [Stappia albiluteola]MBA5775723.1 DUF4159 domain-containing protein [Stappia albiluteola]